MVGGVPARVIKYRFEDQDIEQLLKLQWWSLPDAVLSRHAALFRDGDVKLLCSALGA